MSDVLEYFRNEKERHLDAAEAIADRAQKAVRGLTEDEEAEVKKHMTEATEFDQKIRDIVGAEDLKSSIKQLGNHLAAEPEQAKPQAHTLGEAITSSDSYQAAKATGFRGKFQIGPIDMPGVRFGAANEGIVFEGQGDNDEMFQHQRIPGIQTPAEVRLAVADLFAQGVITRGNSVMLVRESVTSNAAAVVAELGAKPPSDIQFDTENVTLAKIATIIKASNEMLEDEPAMAGYLTSRLGTFVRQQEEEEIVADLIAQVTQTADEDDVTGSNLYDAILAGAVKVRENGGMDADSVAMTMADFAALSVLKDGVNGGYYSGGPYGMPGRLLWGQFNVAIADGLGDGNIIVGAFKQGGTVWRKNSGVTVDATNSNEDDFKKNLVAFRAEERVILFLQRPDAFCKVALAS